MTTTAQNLLYDKCSLIAELALSIGVPDHETPLTLVALLRDVSETAESALRQAVPLALEAGASREQVNRALRKVASDATTD